MQSRVEKAIELFEGGYNCAQSVFVAYADLYQLDKETALKLASSFGGGLGGLREICGAVSAMSMVAGLQNGMVVANDKETKHRNYNSVQFLADEFKHENGSILCKHLIGLESGLPPGKTQKPCVEYVRICAELIEKNLINKK